MEKLRLGILGPGRIVARVMKDLLPHSQNVRVTAVASRSAERAREAARAYGAPYVYDSYEALAKSEEVDLVYIATPHNFHCAQALMMMDHGKHVICEKPMALNEAEVQRMIDCARKNHVFLMEAMWTRFFPASAKLRSLVASGAIGRLTHIYGEFSYAGSFDPESRAYSRQLAGGALLDLGVYPMMAVTDLMGYQPVQVQGMAHLAPTGVDMRACVQFKYASGATAQIVGSMDGMGRSVELIYGSEGRIEVEDFWHPTKLKVFTRDGEQHLLFPEETEGHYHEFDEAAALIQQGRTQSPLMSWEESIRIAAITTELRRQWGVIYPEEE